MSLYHIASLTKVIIGCVTLIIIGMTIDPFQDPGIGIGFGAIGVFLVIRGVSYFIFYMTQKYYSDRKLHLIAADSYKLSLMIGLYTLVNVLLIVTELWTKLVGILLLGLFVGLQVLITKLSDTPISPPSTQIRLSNPTDTHPSHLSPPPPSTS